MGENKVYEIKKVKNNNYNNYNELSEVIDNKNGYILQKPPSLFTNSKKYKPY
jgi:hypothetical protein